MATQIGPKIGVDGEAEYRQQMARINSEAKALQAEMRQLKTEVTDEASAQENAAKQAENFSNQISNQKTRVELLTEQLEKATAEYGEGSTQVNNFREKLANAQTVLNQMQRDLQGAKTDVDNLSEAEEKSGEKAESMGQKIMAHLISDVILDGLRALASLAERASQALWGTVTASAEYADTYLTMAQTTGLSTDQLQEFSFMAELVDVSLETMTGSMTKLTRQMNAARGGNETAGEAFSRLGIRITNADGALRDSSEVFFEIIDALGQMEDGSERDALAMDVFGKSAQELNPLIAAGRKGIEGFAEEARAMGYVLDEETLNRLGQLDDSFNRLTNLRTMISNRLGAGMAPAVERVVDKLIELGDRIDWEALGQGLGGLIEALTDGLIRLADSGAIERLISWSTSKIGGFVTDYFTARENVAAYAATLKAPEDAVKALAEYALLAQRLADSGNYMHDGIFDTEQLQADTARFGVLQAEYGKQFGELTDQQLEEIARLVSAAMPEGEEMMSSFAEGIEAGATTYLAPALETVAQMIDSYLHHSTPDIGPLAHDDEWMPDMLSGWARQINDNSYLVRDAMAGLAFDLQDVLRPGMQAGGGVNYGGVSVVIYGADGQSASDLYEEFSYRLNQDVLDREAVFA